MQETTPQTRARRPWRRWLAGGLAGLAVLFVAMQLVPPISWLIQQAVDSGRAAFDISNWDRPQNVDVGELTEVIRGGSMPPWFYKPLHPASRLSGADERALIAGLERTVAASPPIGGG